MPDWWSEFLRFLLLIMSLLFSQIPVPPWLNPQPPPVPTPPTVPGVIQPAATPYPPVVVPTAASPIHAANQQAPALPRPTIAVGDSRGGAIPVAEMPANLGSRALIASTGAGSSGSDRIVNPSGLPHWPSGQRPLTRRAGRGTFRTSEATPAPSATPGPLLPAVVTGSGLLFSGIVFALHRFRLRH
ncbi:MAG: hypothetical protein ACUVX9_11390 [Anaerolineae bacterium]